MFDRHGFRLNVGIILANSEGRLFWGKRVGTSGWQFPQGGLNPDETLEEGMYRELGEEIGLEQQDVKVLAVTKNWMRYTLPVCLRRKKQEPRCIGQKQRWFLLLLTSSHERINLTTTKKPEFTTWQWVDYWLPVKQVIYFKKRIYSRALRELAPALKAHMAYAPKPKQSNVAVTLSSGTNTVNT